MTQPDTYGIDPAEFNRLETLLLQAMQSRADAVEQLGAVDRSVLDRLVHRHLGYALDSIREQCDAWSHLVDDTANPPRGQVLALLSWYANQLASIVEALAGAYRSGHAWTGSQFTWWSMTPVPGRSTGLYDAYGCESTFRSDNGAIERVRLADMPEGPRATLPPQGEVI